jgi:hypothetical protein
MVVMPPIVSAYVLDSFDERRVDRLRAKAIVDAILPEVERQTKLRSLNPFPPERIKECGEPCLDLLQSLMSWGAEASLEITAQMRGRKDFKRDSVVDWRALRSYERLQNAMGADFVLIIRISDTRETGGRVLASAFAGMHTYWKKIASACVADLHYGRMVWCDSKVDGFGDLTNPASAQSTIFELLSSFESHPQPSR